MATSSTENLNKLIFRIISNTASELGVRVFVVGEYVRDCFLGRENNCIDIVVETAVKLVVRSWFSKEISSTEKAKMII